MTFGAVPLKHVASLNDDKLPDSTHPDLKFRYIDIGSVGRGYLAEQPEPMTFASAPSRARRLVAPGDTIISTVRTYLRAVWAVDGPTDDLVVSTGFAVVRPRKLEAAFLRWAVQADSFVEEVVRRSTGVSYPAINPGDLAMVPVCIPPLIQQRRIAEFLESEAARIDALIAAKQEMLSIVQARLIAAQHWSHQTSVSEGIPVQIRRVFARRQDEPRRGDPVVTAFRDGQVTSRDLRRPDGYTLSLTEHGYQRVEAGDLVFHGLDGFAGACGVAEVDGKCSGVYHVCAPSPGVLSEFAAIQLQVLAQSGYLTLQASSVRERAVDLRNWDKFGSIPIPVPSLAMQQEHVAVVARARSVADRLRSALTAQIGLLRERRQALITAAVTGELEV